MKLSNIIVFLSVVTTIYFLVNYYIYIRGLQSLAFVENYKLIYKVIFIVLVFSLLYKLFSVFFPVIHPEININENSLLFKTGKLFNLIGSFWLAAMLYFFLTIVFFDLIRLINKLIGIYPDFIINNYDITKLILFATTVIFVSGLLIYGFINANNIKITKLELNINKKASNIKSLNIMAISDIHLGGIGGKLKVNKIASFADEIKPDIILFAGDVLDEEVKMAYSNLVCNAIKQLKAPFGVYAILGNHEYLGGIKNAINFYKLNNISLLVDTTILIDNSFYLVGRDDKESKRFANHNRKELEEIIKDINKELPIILLDHQPFDLKPAEKLGVDLQISGHTHRGQLFPFNFLTDKIFELSYGYKKRGDTHYYVSSGLGGWGPPVRIGTKSEIVNIVLKFN